MGEVLVQMVSSLVLDLCLRHRKADLIEHTTVCRLRNRWSRTLNCLARALSEFSQIMRLGRQIDGREDVFAKEAVATVARQRRPSALPRHGLSRSPTLVKVFPSQNKYSRVEQYRSLTAAV